MNILKIMLMQLQKVFFITLDLSTVISSTWKKDFNLLYSEIIAVAETRFIESDKNEHFSLPVFSVASFWLPMSRSAKTNIWIGHLCEEWYPDQEFTEKHVWIYTGFFSWCCSETKMHYFKMPTFATQNFHCMCTGNSRKSTLHRFAGKTSYHDRRFQHWCTVKWTYSVIYVW